MREILVLFSIIGMILIFPGVFAEEPEIFPTDKGSIIVSLSTIPEDPIPGEQSKLKIDFLNPQSNRIQEHIDYWITVSKDGVNTFGPIPRTHTSSGSVTIPVDFSEKGTYKLLVELDGILFVPIPKESASFEIFIGIETHENNKVTEIPDWIKNNAGWWSEGLIGDSDFVQGIQFLIQNDIMIIPPTSQNTETASDEIPDWIKNNAGWWSDGLITDNDFVQGLQYLIENGIIKIS